MVHLDRIAVALIVDDQDRVLMSWRYRFVTEQWGYELLGGMVDAGEDAAGTAAREAEEESGWRPVGEPEHLVSFEPLPGQVTAPVDVFSVARRLSGSGSRPIRRKWAEWSGYRCPGCRS